MAAAVLLLLPTLGAGAGASGDAPREAATGLRAMYASINASAVDVYFAGALADPRVAVGDSQPCLRADNAVSSRPSPLAAPPFPAASIAQRADLARTLAVYMETMTALTVRPSTAAADALRSDLMEALSRVSADASRHEQHDLAIASLVSALTAAVAPIAAGPSADAAKRVVIAADPTVRELIGVLGKDASSAHVDAVEAARSAYAAWTAEYDRARRLALPGASRGSRMAAALPPCTSPAGVAQPRATSVPIDPAADVATYAMRAAVLARVDRANERYRLLSDADPAMMLASLGTVNHMLVQTVRTPGSRGAAPALDAALTAFRADAQALADAFAALEKR